VRLVCPSCGAVASLEAWLSDPDWREMIEFLPSIPGQIQRRAISYLALWRKNGKALNPAKALKILKGLNELVSEGTVHWEHGETRPAPLELWAEALDATIESRPSGLANHNYLRHVAWEKAAGLASRAEANRERQRQHRAAHEEEAPAGEDERQAVAEMLKGFTGRFRGGN